VSLGIFSVVPPTEPCALRSTQPLKVSTRDLSWGKGGRCVWLTTYHPCSAETSKKSGALTYPEPLGPPRPVAGDLYFTVFWYVTPYSMVHRYQCFWETSQPFHQIIRRHIAEDHNLNCGHYLRGPLTELLFLYRNNSVVSSSAGPISFDIT